MIYEVTHNDIAPTSLLRPGAGVQIVATGQVGYISAIRRDAIVKRFGVSGTKGFLGHFSAKDIFAIQGNAPADKKSHGLISKQCRFTERQAEFIKKNSARFSSESEFLRHLIDDKIDEALAE